MEKAEQVVSREDATRLERRVRGNNFTLQDMRDQLESVKRMGPFDRLVDLIPGMGQMAPHVPGKVDPRALVETMAIIDSMTTRERARYQLLDGSRRRRIAHGSGTTVPDVNRLVKQFVEMRRMLKTVGAVSRSRKKKGGRRRGSPMHPGAPMTS